MDRVVIAVLTLCTLTTGVTSYTHYRLPTAIRPDLYNLKIITHLNPSENFTFNGEVSILFNVLEDTTNITLHARDLNIDESNIQLQNYNGANFHMCLERVEKVKELDYFILHLCQTLPQGQFFELNLSFSGFLNERWNGYYRSSYRDATTNETRWLAVTQFEPTAARLAFPCWDEPNYKAKFQIWLGHHKSLKALSNMPLEKQVPLQGLQNFVWSIFEQSIPMSSYLVAYTINDFVYKETKIEGSDIVFRVWSREDYIPHAEYAAEVSPKILKYYEDILGISFPLRKLDQIALPDFFARGMENWGLITYDERDLLLKPNSTHEKAASIAESIAHELAHQWFGNLVTMKWWTDVWLNEGFATYIATLGEHFINPLNDRYNIRSLRNTEKIFQNDAKLSSHPLSQEICNSRDILKRFDSIAYKKGSAILRMTHMFMGQEGFFAGIHNYLEKHKYKNAEQDDLWMSLTETAHKFKRIKPQVDMKIIMDSWTLQTGYPLVLVQRNYETGSMEISQQRFLLNSTFAQEESEKCWWVPLSYTTAFEKNFSNTNAKTWLECNACGKSVVLKLANASASNDWIIFNIQLSGLYRVMYDRENWKLIGETLRSKKFTDIHVMNRVHLVEDVITFAWNGYLGYDIYFDILEYLRLEEDQLPWESAVASLKDIYNLLKPFPEHTNYFRSFVRYIIEPFYNHMGGLNITLQLNGIYNKVMELACRVDQKDCVHAALSYFQKWKLSKNPLEEEYTTPITFKRIIYCTAIRHGDHSDWNYLWQRFSEYPEQTLMAGLGCSLNQTLLHDFVSKFFAQEDIDKRQLDLLDFSEMANGEIAANIVLKHYLDYISKFPEKIDDFKFLLFMDDILLPKDFEKFNKIIDLNKDKFKDSNSLLEITLQSVNWNMKWIANNLEQVKTSLKHRLSLIGNLENKVIA